MYERICISCFGDMGEYDRCPHCGYVDSGSRKHAMLPARYVLQERYLIGEVLSTDKNCVCYKAMDMQENRIVEVQEHFPREIVTRDADSMALVPLERAGTQWPDKSVQTLFRNAQAMMQFSQRDGILHVYDTFLANQTVYIVNEYVEGMLLEDYLKQCGGTVDTDTALSIVLPILDGLAQLHKAELIHRAVTPKNIIITSDNSIKLINFVFLKEASAFQENEMTVYFSPGYAPYEQYVTKERRGPFTDIYSVGAVLYRMLVGRPPQDPIERKGEDRLRQSLDETDLPEYIVLCICKAMHMNKDIRFKSAADMKNALLQNTELVDVDGHLEMIRKRRQIGLIAGLAVVFAALVAVLIILIIKYF
ncbi:MAG: protein kinase [Clostridia bacterium]|nr:protein kinase [Clostridia bacterium]